MQPFLIRLVIGCLVIWLVDRIVSALRLSDTAQRIIEAVTILIAVLFILFGSTVIR